MADEAFALSPISARAAQPNEEDYAAIHQAFMETSRGRWFLGEYAKRNRNADTRLVLDAVARIEQNLTAQKEAAAEADLMEALAAIREAVGEAQAAVNAGLDALAFDERLAPVARAVRIIREISWRWRETGADGRICDILDSQVAAIENSAAQITLAEARAAIDQAFAAIGARVDRYSHGEAAPAEARDASHPAADANVVPFPAQPEEVAEAEAEAAVVAKPVAELAPDAVAAPDVGFADPMPTDDAETAGAAAPLADVVGAIEFADEVTPEAADAQDEAVLDLIAAEMAAPQPIDDDIVIAEAAIAAAEAAETAEPVTAASSDEVAEPQAEAVAATPSPPVQPESPAAAFAEPAHVAEAEVSIGSAILASGILNKPAAPASDPLAPIRRMSQAEKIAFFS
jgi:hypothetical protein